MEFEKKISWCRWNDLERSNRSKGNDRKRVVKLESDFAKRRIRALFCTYRMQEKELVDRTIYIGEREKIELHVGDHFKKCTG